ncbi:MAG: hypothetical protein ACR2RF_25450 [Geminicoccaceae bacterium]
MKMAFPTVMAFDDGQLVGFMATLPSKDAVMTGPLVVKEGRNRGWVALRLFDAYEGILRWFGVTKYLIPVGKSSGSLVDAVGRLLEQKPFAEDNDDMWFVRELKDA